MPQRCSHAPRRTTKGEIASSTSLFFASSTVLCFTPALFSQVNSMHHICCMRNGVSRRRVYCSLKQSPIAEGMRRIDSIPKFSNRCALSFSFHLYRVHTAFKLTSTFMLSIRQHVEVADDWTALHVDHVGRLVEVDSSYWPRVGD